MFVVRTLGSCRQRARRSLVSLSYTGITTAWATPHPVSKVGVLEGAHSHLYSGPMTGAPSGLQRHHMLAVCRQGKPIYTK